MQAEPGTPSPTTGWQQRPERSYRWLLRLMVWLSLKLGRRAGRLILHGIAAYFLLFAPRARRASYQYLQRVLPTFPTLADRYRHVFTFATTIHDRIYLLNGRFDLFDLDTTGIATEVLQHAPERGLFLVGAHLGSFEVLRALGREKTQHTIAMLMYAQQAAKLNAVLAAINPAAAQEIIPLGELDSMLRLHAHLQAGGLSGILADRTLQAATENHAPAAATAQSAQESLMLPFLGTPARFSLGPMRLAAMLRCPVYFMAGLHQGGNRYRIILEPLADFSACTRNTRQTMIEQAVRDYAARLEHFCRLAPYNWFNFFDFWQTKS